MAGAPEQHKRNLYLRFHENHGTNIQLGPQNIMASRISGQEFNGIVMSDMPMETGFLYQILINEVHHRYMDTSLGVVAQYPDFFRPLRANFSILSPDVFCAEPSITYQFSEPVYKQTPALRKIPVGTKLGLSVDCGHNLHLHLNEQDQGIIGTGVPAQRYFMLDMIGYIKGVTCLPVKCLTCEDVDLTPFPSNYYPAYVYQ